MPRWVIPDPAKVCGAGPGSAQSARIEQQRYSRHSFHIGAATTAASNGLEDCLIKTLGRWESVAYSQYVKIPHQQLAGYSKLLVS